MLFQLKSRVEFGGGGGVRIGENEGEGEMMRDRRRGQERVCRRECKGERE